MQKYFPACPLTVKKTILKALDFFLDNEARYFVSVGHHRKISTASANVPDELHYTATMHHWLSSLSASPNAQCSELTEAGNNGFNRQEQGAAIFRVFNELRIAQIKSLGRFILRLNHHSPYADAL